MTTQPIPTTTDDLVTELEYTAEEYSSVSPGEGDILMRAAERIRELEQAMRWRDSYDRSDKPGPEVKQIMVPTDDAGIQIKPASCWEQYTNWMPAPDFPSDFWGENDTDNPL